MKKRVLVIDDHPDFGCLARRAFEREGFEVCLAETGTEGLNAVPSFRPDLILVDAHLPDISGIEVYRALRRHAATRFLPVVLVSGQRFPKGMLEAAGLGLHAEAVYHKDGDFQHLLDLCRCAMRAAASRGGANPNGRLFCRGPLTVDLDRREIHVLGGARLKIPVRRFDLLVALMRAQGPLTAEELQRRVWPGSDDFKKVGVNIWRLRQDISAIKCVSIETVGDSYVLVVERPR